MRFNRIDLAYECKNKHMRDRDILKIITEAFMQRVNKNGLIKCDAESVIGECTVGGRYRLLKDSGKTLRGIGRVYRARALDIYTGRRVELHIYSAEDGGMLMREADITSALEGIGEGREGYASVPALIDAHLPDGDAEPFGYLVYPCDTGTVTLGAYLERHDADPEVAYSALLAAADTLIYASELGIFHGLLCERTVVIHESTRSYTLEGFGVYDEISFDDDAERAKVLLRRIDRRFGARVRRLLPIRRRASEAISALERVKRRGSRAEAEQTSKTSKTPKPTEPKSARRAIAVSQRLSPLARALSCVCMLCLAAILSGVILIDAKLFGTDGSREVEIPSLVGLVYGGYDAEDNVYILKDGEGRTTRLDADIFKLEVSGSDEYAEPPLIEAGSVNGTVICQEPEASRRGKAIPGKSRAEIGITVLKDKNLNGSEVELEALGIYGSSIERAEALLARYGITVDRAVRYNKSIPEGTVYYVSDTGTGARIGGTVRLYVSGGEAQH